VKKIELARQVRTLNEQISHSIIATVLEDRLRELNLGLNATATDFDAEWTHAFEEQVEALGAECGIWWGALTHAMRHLDAYRPAREAEALRVRLNFGEVDRMALEVCAMGAPDADYDRAWYGALADYVKFSGRRLGYGGVVLANIAMLVADHFLTNGARCDVYTAAKDIRNYCLDYDELDKTAAAVARDPVHTGESYVDLWLERLRRWAAAQTLREGFGGAMRRAIVDEIDAWWRDNEQLILYRRSFLVKNNRALTEKMQEGD
jgi:hypothetical protein